MRLLLLLALASALLLPGCPEQECIDNCSDELNRICGIDDRTYDNSCIALCVGVEVQYSGRCTGETDPVDQQ